MLQGATNTISKHKPLIVCEIEKRHIRGGNVHSVLDFLKELGYNGSFVCNKKLVPIIKFDANIHQKEVGDRFWDKPDYCNNFILLANK